MTLTFVSVDEILCCDHSSESSLPVLSHSAIRNLPLATFGSEMVKGFLWRAYKRRGFYPQGLYNWIEKALRSKLY